MKSYCKDCDHATNHDILAEYFFTDSEDEAQWWEKIKYQIIKCNGCDRIQFRLLYRDSSISSYSSEEDENWEEELYPKYNENDLKPKDFKFFPVHLKKLYQEIIRSYNIGNFILCSIGIRIILEGICEEKNIKGGLVWDNNKGEMKFSKMLNGKISGLVEKKLFSEANQAVLDSLRLVGNDAAHEVRSPSKEGLIEAISIIEHTIDHIYELKMKNIT